MEMNWKICGGHRQDGEPSTDNPVEIETVGSNENLFDRSIFRAGGRVGADTKRLYSMQTYKFLKDEKYTISTNLDLTKYSYALNLLQDNISTSTVLKDDGWKSVQPLTFNYTVSDYYVGLIIKKQDNSEISLKEIEDVWFKIEEGSIATAYSSFEMGSVEIDVVNKNLIDKNRIEKGVMITATAVASNSKYFSTDYIKVSSNKIYYANEYVPVVVGYDKNKKAIGYTRNISLSGNFNVGDAAYIRARNSIQLSTEEEIQNAINKAMITESQASTDYIAHQSQTAIMPIQQPMLNGDYIADVEHHEWGKLVLTGDESWIYDAANKRFYFNLVDRPDTLLRLLALCTHYKNGNSETTNHEFNIGSTQVFIRDERFSSILEWKSYLQAQKTAKTPVTMYYKLAEPLNLELTSEQKAVRETKLNTYKNITNINLSDELASIDVTYKKDLETIINNALATNSVAEGEK